jgi:hypothetical protein
MINETINHSLIIRGKKMKKLIALFAVTMLVLSYTNISAQSDTTTTNPPIQHGKNFVDNNGDGYNDNAPDDDGDGIPNGLDPDYTGPKLQRNKFVDLNGDGINDNAGKGKRNGKSSKGGYGTCNGTGIQTNSGTGTQTGTGTQAGKGRGYKGGK